MYKYAVLDIETTGLDRYKHQINYVGIGLAKSIDQPLSKKIILNMTKESDVSRFKKICDKLKRDKIRLIWQGGKFDTLFIEHHYGIKLPISHDILVMGTAYELSTSHKLKDMAVRYLGVEDWDIPLREKIKPNSPLVEEYLGKDLDNPWELYKYFVREMDLQQRKIYKHLLRPAYKLYRRIERNGIYLDKKTLAKVRKEYKAKQEAKAIVLKQAHDINWNSPRQVSDALFNKEKMPTIKLSQKTGAPSADAKVLKRLKAQGFQLASDLLDYKFYYGANTKFLNKWGSFAEYDGRIRPNFGLTNVVTGRTSCSNPNLQQVPRNPELRTLFTAPPGRVLIEADYSQIELRIAADYANEPTMLQIYKDGGDIHMETAMSISGQPKDRVTKEMRSRAKPVNFGFVYEMSAKGFVGYAFDSYEVVFTLAEAQRYKDLFFLKYPGLLRWHKEMEITCELLGGVYNRFGRFMSLPDIYSANKYERAKAIRRAINGPVQGTASDLLLSSAVEIDKKLSKFMDLKIVGTVHDSILMDIPEDCVKDASKEVKKIMANPKALEIFEVSFKVPLEADIAIGPWGSK